jgi:hypothetical protein
MSIACTCRRCGDDTPPNRADLRNISKPDRLLWGGPRAIGSWIRAFWLQSARLREVRWQRLTNSAGQFDVPSGERKSCSAASGRVCGLRGGIDDRRPPRPRPCRRVPDPATTRCVVPHLPWHALVDGAARAEGLAVPPLHPPARLLPEQIRGRA